MAPTQYKDRTSGVRKPSSLFPYEWDLHIDMEAPEPNVTYPRQPSSLLWEEARMNLDSGRPWALRGR